MTPFDAAKGLAYFLKEKLDEYDEQLGDNACMCSARNVYAGFLPRARSVAELEKCCPAIVVRPDVVTDEKERSIVSMIIYVTVYDKDLDVGCTSLYHLLEFVRAHLLMNNAVSNKYWIQPGAKTTVPDDQPYPQWIGSIEFDVVVPRVASTSPLAKEWN